MIHLHLPASWSFDQSEILPEAYPRSISRWVQAARWRAMLEWLRAWVLLISQMAREVNLTQYYPINHAATVEHSTNKPALWPFFTLAFGLSWLFWIPAALLGQPVITFPYIILMTGGGLGPALAELVLVFAGKNAAHRADYLRRVFDPHRIPARWHAVIWLAFPLINAMAMLLGWLASGAAPEFATARGLLADPIRLIPFAGFLFLFGPLPEELGWRGYALDALQARWNALFSSLLLGAAWVVWHLPLFFMRGTFQNEMGFGSLGFWSFCLSTLASSVLLTWIYNNTNRSTLSAILFHFMINFSGELFSLAPLARGFQSVLVILLAVIVVLYWGPHKLIRPRAGQVVEL